ncbi:MAG: hypothetical protein WB714_23460 [Candidatus Sulfotelmatobacter sp.]
MKETKPAVNAPNLLAVPFEELDDDCGERWHDQHNCQREQPRPRSSRSANHYMPQCETAVKSIARFDPDKGEEKAQSCEKAWSIKGNVKNIFLPPRDAQVYFATSSPSHQRRRSSGVLPVVIPSQQLDLR